MDFTNRVCQSLHDEHMATLALFERVEQLLARHKRADPPDAADAGVARLLRDVSTWVDTEINRHFDFEEKELFTFLDERGDKSLGTSLTDEHGVIRPLGARLGALSREAAGRPFDPAIWDEFWRSGQELSERIRSHVQKEEMALLPAIEDAMDPDTDARLYQEYADTL
ncbi:MAG TPA: hemerythrin domain-containing protein [Xanthobacteraceae bacterium]|nr:hemerythrin domain-containing protein [Xanthobacteraceae bacterium]